MADLSQLLARGWWVSIVGQSPTCWTVRLSRPEAEGRAIFVAGDTMEEAIHRATEEAMTAKKERANG